MKEYVILGFSTGCNPCAHLKEFMKEHNLTYQFIDGKVTGNPDTLTLKKEVKNSSMESVVPALFIKEGSVYTLVATGVEDCKTFIQEDQE